MLSDFDLEGKNKLQKAAYYLQNYGITYTTKKALRKLGVPLSQESEYMTWCRRMEPSKAELNAQRKSGFEKTYHFTIVLEPGNESRSQEWKKQTVLPVSVLKLREGKNARDILQRVKGDYLVYSGKNAVPRVDYLYEICKALETGADLIYTDEDNICGKKRYRPFFKPDESLEFLLNFQYLGRMFVIKKDLLERIVEGTEGELTVLGDGWYDIALQAFRFAGHICHIPKVLFSNETEEGKKTDFIRNTGENQRLAIEHYLKTEGLKGSVKDSDVDGFFHVEYEPDKEPMVSIIIPNKDHTEDLGICLNSLREKESYRNFEVVIAENNSEEKATFEYYEKIQREDERIHVVTFQGGFNYSAINNFAVRHAKGELFLFLNNDTEFIDGNAIKEMVSSVLKEGVGACGAMLYYGDDTIQHAGVIIGMGGFAAHALWSLTDRDEKYYPFSLCEREVSAVTGACLMVRRSVYDEVEGMGEDFAVALNDVDFCMKICEKGHKILFNPYAKLYHYESKSRGYEDTVEKQARFQKEIDHFQSKWEKEIKAGDPYYNPNLTLHRADYSMDI
ncbi:MAG: glycosyltransferase family 2 protein [Roseburia sp.]|nr:glycosyltransferase family 2 protein [Roseburia sp.]